MSDRVTVRAAAGRLGIGYSTLKQWIYDGAVRTTRTTGGHHRFAESEVTRLLASGGETAAPAAPLPRQPSRARVRLDASRVKRFLAAWGVEQR